MGFLRKIGRKIKKGAKKLFSSKLGSLIGSIAIGMILGPVIGNAWKGIKGALGVGQGVATGTTAAATGTTAAATGTTAAATGTTAAATTTAETLASSINMPSTIPAASSIPSGQINMSAIEKSITSGPFNVSNTVTGAINNTAASAGIPGFNTKAFERAMATTNVPTELSSQVANLTSTVSPKTVTDINQPFFGEGGKLREYGQNVKKDFQEGFSAGEIASGVVTGYATTSLLSGDQTDEGGYGSSPASQPPMEQASYIQDIAASYANATGSTRLPSFQEISQQTLYGNGSPQSFYQPLNLPNIG